MAERSRKIPSAAMTSAEAAVAVGPSMGIETLFSQMCSSLLHSFIMASSPVKLALVSFTVPYFSPLIKTPEQLRWLGTVGRLQQMTCRAAKFAVQ